MTPLRLAVCLICAVVIPTCYAQNPAEDYLGPHNSARAAVGVGPLSWDEKLASYARNYSSQRKADCNLDHSGGPYGECLFWGGGPGLNASDAVSTWVSEKEFYDYESNTCATDQECGHYTQVVWRSTERLGCSRVECDSGDTFIICSYDPIGNMEGQRPY